MRTVEQFTRADEFVREGEVSVERVNPLEGKEWDAMVGRHPECSVFHTTGWAAVLRHSYDLTPAYLTLRRGRNLAGVIPLFGTRSWHSRPRGVCLPFTDHSAPLLFGQTRFAEALKEVVRFGREQKWDYVEIRGVPGAFWNTAARKPSAGYYHHVLDLRPGEETLFRQLSSATRRAIRKASGAGLTFSLERSEDAVRAYYELHCKTRRKHGLPPQPYDFFRNIHRFILSKGDGFVALVGVDRQPVNSKREQGSPREFQRNSAGARQIVSGAIILQTARRAIYKFGASDEAHQEWRPNNLLLWNIIRHLSNTGCELLDFGRTSFMQPGLRRFKQGWGTVESVLEYGRYDFRANDFVQAPDRAAGWHTRLFSLCPTPIAIWISKRIYKYLG
jgi:hypothetical protein